eukprot:8288837-Pyramimonas_sp.AAC.1
MDGTATEAPCAICRGVGLITAEFLYALAGDQDALDRHGEIFRVADKLRGLREELNRVAAMMAINAAAPTTTPAGQPASSANAGQATEATAPAVDTPMPLIAEAANNAGTPVATCNRTCRGAGQRHVVEAYGEPPTGALSGFSLHMPACRTGETRARAASAGQRDRRARAAAPVRYPSATCYTLC